MRPEGIKVYGSNPGGYVTAPLARSQKFNQIMAVAFGLLILVVATHVVGVKIARRKVKEQKRLRKKEPNKKKAHKKRKGRTTVVDKLEFAFGLGRDGGYYDSTSNDAEAPDALEKFSHSHPRLIHYILMFASMTVSRQCATVFSDDRASIFRIIFAAMMFVSWPLGFLWYTFTVLRRKVVHEQRATLVCDQHRRVIEQRSC